MNGDSYQYLSFLLFCLQVIALLATCLEYGCRVLNKEKTQSVKNVRTESDASLPGIPLPSLFISGLYFFSQPISTEPFFLLTSKKIIIINMYDENYQL